MRMCKTSDERKKEHALHVCDVELDEKFPHPHQNRKGAAVARRFTHAHMSNNMPAVLICQTTKTDTSSCICRDQAYLSMLVQTLAVHHQEG